MWTGVVLSVLLWAATALADQRSFEVERGRQDWSFDVRWSGADGEARRAQFSLPAELVTADLEEPLRYQKNKAAQHAVAAVRAYGEGKRGVKLKARAAPGGQVLIEASGKNRERVRATLAEAAAVRDRALAEFTEEAGFTTHRKKILPDHPTHALRYADALAPVVAALGGPTEDPREFADIALGFVQSIPYEQRALVRDRFRRPLSLLGRNRGDCDSKATLYLSLMRQAYPSLPLAIVYVPDHAYVALGIPPQKGDDRMRHDGQAWVLAEPVGPALAPVGDLSRLSRRKGALGRARLVPVPARRLAALSR